jgi:hypothetical protein
VALIAGGLVGVSPAPTPPATGTRARPATAGTSFAAGRTTPSPSWRNAIGDAFARGDRAHLHEFRLPLTNGARGTYPRIALPDPGWDDELDSIEDMADPACRGATRLLPRSSPGSKALSRNVGRLVVRLAPRRVVSWSVCVDARSFGLFAARSRGWAGGNPWGCLLVRLGMGTVPAGRG